MKINMLVFIAITLILLPPAAFGQTRTSVSLIYEAIAATKATKVFINWLLGKEGQELYRKAMGQATRRFDVETKWMVEHGVRASKDFLTVEENNRLENYGEDTINNYWAKSAKIAEEVFK